MTLGKEAIELESHLEEFTRSTNNVVVFPPSAWVFNKSKFHIVCEPLTGVRNKANNNMVNIIYSESKLSFHIITHGHLVLCISLNGFNHVF